MPPLITAALYSFGGTDSPSPRPAAPRLTSASAEPQDGAPLLRRSFGCLSTPESHVRLSGSGGRELRETPHTTAPSTVLPRAMSSAVRRLPLLTSAAHSRRTWRLLAWQANAVA